MTSFTLPSSGGLRYRFALAAGVLAILVWFSYFAAQSLREGFVADDMMNIYFGYSAGPWKLLKANLMFWSSFYRPLGSAFCAGTFSMFGLAPLPYRVAILTVLALSILAVFVTARRLTQHDGIAWTAAFLSSYRVGLHHLLFSSAYVYDALASLFFFTAFAVYLEPRRRAEPLTVRRAISVILLYVCALNSKEIAVSFPVMLLLYEAAMHPPQWASWRSLAQWLRGPALVPLIAGAMTALYIYGKSTGPGSLMVFPSYQPVFTWNRFILNQARFMNDIFAPLTQVVTINVARTLQIWGILAYSTWRTRRPILVLLTGWVILTPLPIALIEGRGGGCLYIPTFGWVLIVSIAAWDLIGFLSRDRLFYRVPGRMVQAVLACLFIFVAAKSTYDYHARLSPHWRYTGELTAHILKQFGELDFRPRSNEQLVFVDSPFEGWDLVFIATLYWHNPKLNVVLNDQTPLSQEELNKADYLIGYRDDRFIVHKRPM